ncbi:MAG: hypothetical protein PHP02_08210 [Eubacteriales bacterium]|nr:hypothetical protein [Eubacteriales bacterium]
MERKTAGKKSPKLVFKPWLLGRWASPLAARRGGRIVGYVAMSAFVFFFMGQLMAMDIAWLRILINLVVLGLMGLVYYSDGARMGEGDVAFAEIAHARREEGKAIPQKDLDRCFHPAKGFFTALVGVAPFVLICLIYAPLAKLAAYSLGVLPSWLEGYQTRADIGLALSYYQQQPSFGFADALRLIVRLLVFPFVNLVGAENAAGVLWVERLSPLLVMLAPLWYGMGYRRGEKLRAMVHGGIAANRSRKRRGDTRAKQAAREPKQLL